MYTREGVSQSVSIGTSQPLGYRLVFNFLALDYLAGNKTVRNMHTTTTKTPQ